MPRAAAGLQQRAALGPPDRAKVVPCVVSPARKALATGGRIVAVEPATQVFEQATRARHVRLPWKQVALATLALMQVLSTLATIARRLAELVAPDSPTPLAEPQESRRGPHVRALRRSWACATVLGYSSQQPQPSSAKIYRMLPTHWCCLRAQARRSRHAPAVLRLSPKNPRGQRMAKRWVSSSVAAIAIHIHALALEAFCLVKFPTLEISRGASDFHARAFNHILRRHSASASK